MVGDPGKVDGFSLHAGVAVKATQRVKLERLCATSADSKGGINK